MKNEKAKIIVQPSQQQEQKPCLYTLEEMELAFNAGRKSKINETQGNIEKEMYFSDWITTLNDFEKTLKKEKLSFDDKRISNKIKETFQNNDECTCTSPLIYSALATKCLRCEKKV